MYNDDSTIDMADALGAEAAVASQRLTLYIPNKDSFGNEIGTQRQWVLEAAQLLAKIGGGFTIMPAAEGGWLNEETGELIWELPVLIYSYVKADRLLEHMGQVRSFMHRLGRETQQGEVAIEFDGLFFRINEYDAN